MNTRSWIIFAVAVVAIFAGLIFYSKENTDTVDVTKYDNDKVLTADIKPKGTIPDHVFGLPEDESKVTIVEYGDFQCPYCYQFYTTNESVIKSFEDKITYVFRNFPLTTIHPNARAAASAAEAAGLQGKFWDMYNKLYQEHADWISLDTSKRDDMFNSYAKQLGLNINQFKKDYGSSKVSDKINFDQNLGKANGVTGTPSLFLNGKKLGGDDFSNNSGEKLKKTIEKALKKASSDKKKKDDSSKDSKKSESSKSGDTNDKKVDKKQSSK